MYEYSKYYDEFIIHGLTKKKTALKAISKKLSTFP